MNIRLLPPFTRLLFIRRYFWKYSKKIHLVMIINNDDRFTSIISLSIQLRWIFFKNSNSDIAFVKKIFRGGATALREKNYFAQAYNFIVWTKTALYSCIKFILLSITYLAIFSSKFFIKKHFCIIKFEKIWVQKYF